jgi:hypothetical protein
MATQFTLQGPKPMLGNANVRINTTAMQGKTLGAPLLKVCILQLECSRRQLILIASLFNEIHPSDTFSRPPRVSPTSSDPQSSP